MGCELEKESMRFNRLTKFSRKLGFRHAHRECRSSSRRLVCGCWWCSPENMKRNRNWTKEILMDAGLIPQRNRTRKPGKHKQWWNNPNRAKQEAIRADQEKRSNHNQGKNAPGIWINEFGWDSDQYDYEKNLTKGRWKTVISHQWRSPKGP